MSRARVPRAAGLLSCLALSLISGASLWAREIAPGIVMGTGERLAPRMAGAPEISARAAVLIDAATGTALFAKNHDDEIPPASLTKLMTMRIAQAEIAAGRASLEEIVPIGVESWAQSQPPFSSLMFLEPGQRVTLGELLAGLAVPSGNDAAVAVALRFAPSVQEFSAAMTREARRMGLSRTRFVEPAGISDLNVTTAAEFAAFSRAYLGAHPESLARFHSMQEFSYPLERNATEARRASPGTIRQTNNNPLLWTFPGADGLKTGYIPASGYNIALTAERNGTRFIAVILGAPTAEDRARDGEALLTWAFDNFATVRPVAPLLAAEPLWQGAQRQARLAIALPLDFTAPADKAG
ncbi:MAG: D-alanyl-D-alanine carboxypeptidase, partial [Treponema sp.]|nr:D-alanyl-D-alanine carboxypeptidase [Treponema sp.]